MGILDMSETYDDKAENKKSSGGIKPLIFAALLMTTIAAPAGWFLGSQIGNVPPTNPEIIQKEEKEAGKSIGSTILPLHPIITNLREPENVWVRIEIALVIQDQQDVAPEDQAEISNDFIALLRQMTLTQIKGPTGLMNLREDLFERARIRTGGKISALLISSLVIE